MMIGAIGEIAEAAEATLGKFAESPLAGELEDFESLDGLIEDADEMLESEIPDVGDLEEIKTKTDDNGDVYCIDGNLTPNTTYELNGNVYQTDDQGRIVHCEAKPELSPENPRDINAQREAGGEDRQPNDQGGHIVSRDMNGDGGIGNLVPMDGKINQSDYKCMENTVKDALKDGKDVTVKTDITYSGDSQRPDQINVTVTVDGVDTVYTFDNNLDGSLDKEISEKSPSAKAILEENPDAHVSSIKREYDENGELVSTSATITWTDDEGENHRKPITF